MTPEPALPHCSMKPVLPSVRDIASAFGTHAGSYERYATIQSDIVETLSSLVMRTPEIMRPLWVDVGCGTGLLGSSFTNRNLPISPIGLDISDQCCAHAVAHNAYRVGIQGTITALPFADASLLTITAASVLQWIDPSEQALNEFSRVLKPGGILALASFVQGSYGELSSIRASLGVADPINLPSPEALHSQLQTAGFSVEQSESFHREYRYRSPLHVFRHLVGTGSTAHRNIRYPSVFALAREYRRVFGFENGEVPLTCRAVMIIAKKT